MALNFLGRLSGIATLTARYVDAVEGTGVRILDTRKTTPGLRALEKEAVRAGGGINHRGGLYDAILVKENHAALAGGVAEAARRALAAAPPGVPVEVECATLDEVDGRARGRRAAAAARQHDARRAAPRRWQLAGGRAELEASGGITLDNVRAVAETGVDYISVGALTHSAPALDFSLLLDPLRVAARAAAADGERIRDRQFARGEAVDGRRAAALAPGGAAVAGRLEQAAALEHAAQVGRVHWVAERGGVDAAELGDREALGGEREADVRVGELGPQALAAGEHDRRVVEGHRPAAGRPECQAVSAGARGRGRGERGRGRRWRAAIRRGGGRGR